MKDFKDSQALLQKLIIQMTGEEFLQLTELFRNPSTNSIANSGSQVTLAYGINELAKIMGCCQSTIYALKKEGVLDEAIVSQVGKRIIFDADKARMLADEYQKYQRELRRQQ